MGGDGNANNNFVGTTAIASSCSLISAMQKEEKKNNKQREKIVVWPSRNEKNKFQFHFNIQRPCW
jgi:hypothetical protein